MNSIWQRNARERGERQADAYDRFLDGRLAQLGRQPFSGEAIPELQGIRRLLMQRRASSQGHIAIYRVMEDSVEVLLIYHTSQDWQSYIRRELE